jgi:outer membrane cobalamin receptor
MTGFVRRTQSTLGVTDNATEAANYDKHSLKNILGLSYRLSYIDGLDASLFAKHYYQRSSGPRNTSTTGSYVYDLYTEHSQAFGYGAALAWNFLSGFRAKASFEHACRLPSVDELFGDEDLEMGSIGIKPEKSNNLNVSLAYNKQFGPHSLFAEGGFIYRDTHDYIRRVINKYSGGLYFGSYENHGRVKTAGFNAEARYGWKGIVSVGGNVSMLNMRDNEKYLTGSSQQLSTTYKARVPNTPYLFANSNLGINIPRLGGKKNVLSLSYANSYVHSFPLYWEVHGSSGSKLRVPDQFSHDVTMTYSILNGRYNLTFECRNLTDEKLYDNFSLQKAGRAFYGKIRVFFN